jgi:hypothetical protein
MKEVKARAVMAMRRLSNMAGLILAAIEAGGWNCNGRQYRCVPDICASVSRFPRRRGGTAGLREVRICQSPAGRTCPQADRLNKMRPEVAERARQAGNAHPMCQFEADSGGARLRRNHAGFTLGSAISSWL